MGNRPSIKIIVDDTKLKPKNKSMKDVTPNVKENKSTKYTPQQAKKDSKSAVEPKAIPIYEKILNKIKEAALEGYTGLYQDIKHECKDEVPKYLVKDRIVHLLRTDGYKVIYTTKEIFEKDMDDEYDYDSDYIYEISWKD